MFQKLKTKNLVNCCIAALLMAAAGVFVLALQLDNIRALLSPKVSLNDLAADEIREGMRVDAGITFVLDYYSYTTEEGEYGNAIEKEYLIPVGAQEYMGVVLESGNMRTADDNMEFSWDYMEGDDAAADEIVPIVVSGTICRLSGDSLRFFNEYLDSMELSEGERERFLPYVLKPGYIGDTEPGGMVVLLLFAAVLLGLAVWMLILGLTGSNTKKLRKYCASTGNQELEMARIEQFYQNTEPVGSLRISPEYVLQVQGARVAFAPTPRVIWIYQHVVKHSYNFIPTGKTYSLMFMLDNGERVEFTMKNKKTCEEAMEYVSARLSYVLLGFSKELEEAYKKDRPGMTRAVAAKREEMSGQ